MLMHSRGRYTPTQVDRVSTMSGIFGRTVHTEICRAIGMTDGNSTRSKGDSYKEDIEKFITKVHCEAIFKHSPLRAYHAFPNFLRSTSTTIPRVSEFAGRINKHSSDLDFWRYQSLHLARSRAACT